MVKEWRINLSGSPKKRKRSKPRRGKKNKQFPPPFKLSAPLLDQLVQRYAIHENPDPAPCDQCGLAYKDFKTGFSYQDIFDMLWSGHDDPQFWRHKGRHQVLGLWFEIKRDMWKEHIELCQDQQGQEEWMADFEPGDFAY